MWWVAWELSGQFRGGFPSREPPQALHSLGMSKTPRKLAFPCKRWRQPPHRPIHWVSVCLLVSARRTRSGCALELQCLSVKGSEMQKGLKTVMCTLLNGLAWCTEREYMKRSRSTFDIFFGIKHRMRREEMEERFIKEAKQGWRFAADAEGSPTQKQAVRITSTRREEFFWRSTAEIGKEDGAVTLIPGNEGRIAQAWVNARECMPVFSLNRSNSKASEKPPGTRGACDANMCPEDFKNNQTHVHRGARRRRFNLQIPRPRGRATLTSPVTAFKGRSRKWRWWKSSDQDRTRRSLSW